MAKTYDLIHGLNCARFTYNGQPRVVRVISVDNDHGNLIGQETKKGRKQVNRRYAPVKAYKLSRIKGGLRLSRD